MMSTCQHRRHPRSIQLLWCRPHQSPRPPTLCLTTTSRSPAASPTFAVPRVRNRSPNRSVRCQRCGIPISQPRRPATAPTPSWAFLARRSSSLARRCVRNYRSVAICMRTRRGLFGNCVLLDSYTYILPSRLFTLAFTFTSCQLYHVTACPAHSFIAYPWQSPPTPHHRQRLDASLPLVHSPLVLPPGFHRVMFILHKVGPCPGALLYCYRLSRPKRNAHPVYVPPLLATVSL